MHCIRLYRSAFKVQPCVKPFCSVLGVEVVIYPLIFDSRNYDVFIQVLLSDAAGRERNVSALLAPFGSTSVNATGLDAYTNYTLRVELCTVGGCTTSSAIVHRTLGAPPGPFAITSIIALDDTTVELHWAEPESINQPILRYDVYRNDVFLTSTTNLTSTDATALPNSAYQYVITATNPTGTSTTASAVVVTPEGTPSGVAVPSATALSEVALLIEWTQPAVPGGVVENYSIAVDGVVRCAGTSMFQCTVSNLTRYTAYQVHLTVCNRVGCAQSATVSATTTEGQIAGQRAPSVDVGTDGPAIYVSWYVCEVVFVSKSTCRFCVSHCAMCSFLNFLTHAEMSLPLLELNVVRLHQECDLLGILSVGCLGWYWFFAQASSNNDSALHCIACSSIFNIIFNIVKTPSEVSEMGHLHVKFRSLRVSNFLTFSIFN